MAGEKVIGVVPGSVGKAAHWRIQKRFNSFFFGDLTKRNEEVRHCDVVLKTSDISQKSLSSSVQAPVFLS